MIDSLAFQKRFYLASISPVKKKLQAKKLLLKAVLILTTAPSHLNADDLIDGDIWAFFFATKCYVIHSTTGSWSSKVIVKVLLTRFVINVASFDGSEKNTEKLIKTWKGVNFYHNALNLAEWWNGISNKKVRKYSENKNFVLVLSTAKMKLLLTISSVIMISKKCSPCYLVIKMLLSQTFWISFCITKQKLHTKFYWQRNQ